MSNRRAAETIRDPVGAGRHPGFEPVHVGSYPESPMRCLLYLEDGLVKARINEAHGADAWDHAGYHASAGMDALGFACVVGVPCGYDGDPAYLEWEARPD
jgi:hypothetical protein